MEATLADSNNEAIDQLKKQLLAILLAIALLRSQSILPTTANGCFAETKLAASPLQRMTAFRPTCQTQRAKKYVSCVV